MIRSIQAYRGFAALLVVAFHANLIAGEYFGQSALTQFFSFGHSGVPFFFVLSGFIIYFVHKADIDQPARAGTYLRKRLIRIYPVYWVVTLAVVPAYFLVPSFGSDYHRDPLSILFSLLLLPQSHFPHLTVAWTLIHEMLFYLLFALLILRKAIGHSVFLVWMLATVIAVAAQNFGAMALVFPLSFFLSIYNSLFGLGAVASWLTSQHGSTIKRFQIPAFALGNVVFIAAGCIENYWTGRHDGVIALFGIASFLLVFAAGNPWVERLFEEKAILQLLGNASYSIYLTHYLTVSVLGKIVRRTGLDTVIPHTMTWLLLVVIATVTGIVIYQLIERPLLGVCRQLFLRKNTNRLQ